LNGAFYERFVHYEYILIYQLDAYVFRDELEYWCNRGYDYLGAPWFDGFNLADNDSKLLDIAGNGGLSLRKISSFVKVLSARGDSKKIIEEYIKSRQNEDLFFSQLAPKIDPSFKIAPPKLAMHFSFECLPKKLYQMIGGKLPFGCHAWERYDFDFWKLFIDADSIKCELDLSKKYLESTKKQLDNIYASREWKAVIILQKIVKMIIPKGSLRRKMMINFWKLIKLPWRLFSKTIGKSKSAIFIFKNYLIKFKPKKKRKINRNSKKIVYIGHSYHNKTKSTAFLIDYLKQFYDVKIVLDESWKGESFPNLSFVDESYLAVIFFQSLPNHKLLESIKNENLVFFPMYDGVGLDYSFWFKYKNIKIINFSETLHEKLKSWGFESIYVKYFPKPQEFVPGNKIEVFFLQRLTNINIKNIINLFEKKDLKIHIHKAIDPNQEFIQPSREDEKKYQITYSEWFETREQMWDLIKKKGIYIAPRELEGIGLSFLEAMAMGKAVVAIDNPTMNEYIEHNKTGYLFDLSKPENIDLSNIENIQKNTYEFMQKGYAEWEKNKKKIIDFIEKA